MNTQEPISGFFYNLVPGILFQLGILYLFDGFPFVVSLARGNEILCLSN